MIDLAVGTRFYYNGKLCKVVETEHDYRCAECDLSINECCNMSCGSGTEPQIPNITVEQLFCVINERCELNKGTVFATNLTPRHIEEMYGERIFSRLTAKSLTIFITIEGSDIRGNKNTAV